MARNAAETASTWSIVRSHRERAEFIDEGLVPRGLVQLDVALLALGSEGVGAVFLRGGFPLGIDGEAGQHFDEPRGLELTRAARILRDPDAAAATVVFSRDRKVPFE